MNRTEPNSRLIHSLRPNGIFLNTKNLFHHQFQFFFVFFYFFFRNQQRYSPPCISLNNVHITKITRSLTFFFRYNFFVSLHRNNKHAR